MNKSISRMSKYLWIPIIIVLFLAIAVIIGLIDKSVEEHKRLSMSAEETMYQYMALWQDEKYNDMLEYWVDKDMSLLGNNQEIEYMLQGFKEEKVLDTIEIVTNPTYTNLPDNQKALYVKYITQNNNSSGEEIKTYILIRSTNDSPWLIYDSGY